MALVGRSQIFCEDLLLKRVTGGRGPSIYSQECDICRRYLEFGLERQSGLCPSPKPGPDFRIYELTEKAQKSPGITFGQFYLLTEKAQAKESPGFRDFESPTPARA